MEGKWKFQDIEGDLFSADKNVSLTNCVASDFLMGAGVAVKFKQLFGRVDELLAQNIKIGGVAILQDSDRFIYYLVTKEFTYEKPTYDSLTLSLGAMKSHMVANNVQDLALPRIGCGIDGLEWDKVQEILFNTFNDLPINVTVVSVAEVMAGSIDKFILREISGDLFSAPLKYALGHCVAADLRLGKGIAVKFRDTFGQVTALKSQNVKPGGVAVISAKNRFIYNMVTKSLSYQKPTYQTLSSSLFAMREHMLANDVHFLALPRIGCGLDGLQWNKVKDLINETFGNDQVEIVIYNFVPSK